MQVYRAVLPTGILPVEITPRGAHFEARNRAMAPLRFSVGDTPERAVRAWCKHHEVGDPAEILAPGMESRAEMTARIAALEAIIEGRTTPPTDAEIEAHAAQRCPGLWLTRDDGGNVFVECGGAAVARTRENQASAGDDGTRWISLDTAGRPCAWPVVKSVETKEA